MNRITIACLAGAILAGCTTSAPPPTVKETQTAQPVFQPITNHFYPLSEQEQKLVQAGVNGVLRDPAGGIYSMLRATKDEAGVITVCGLVNARNGYGGYTGGSPFAGQFQPHADGSRSFVPLLVGGDGPGNSYARTHCAQKALTIQEERADLRRTPPENINLINNIWVARALNAADVSRKTFAVTV